MIKYVLIKVRTVKKQLILIDEYWYFVITVQVFSLINCQNLYALGVFIEQHTSLFIVMVLYNIQDTEVP